MKYIFLLTTIFTATVYASDDRVNIRQPKNTTRFKAPKNNVEIRFKLEEADGAAVALFATYRKTKYQTVVNRFEKQCNAKVLVLYAQQLHGGIEPIDMLTKATFEKWPHGTKFTAIARSKELDQSNN